LRAEGNWFGDETGPASTANPGATGGAVLGAVDISPWLADGTDADEATMGFQPAVDAAVNYLPTRLEFAVEPSDTTLGAILAPAVVVTVMNENDEPATQFAGSVTLGFGANPGLGELEGTLTVPCTAGVATFADLKVTKGGGSGFALAASAADPILGVPSALFDVANPAPVLTAISPIFRTAGTLGTFTLTLTGSDFVPTSVVRWNGQDRPTAYGTSGQITAQIPQADVAAAGTASVTVYTPPAGGGTSGSLTFTITAAAQAPVVHVDSAWTGPAVCGGHVWGYDAFATVQGGINAVAVGGAVNVAAGTYTEDVLLNKAGIAVLGAGADVTTVVGPIGGASETFKFGAEGVVLDGFTITRAGNTVAEWNLALNGTGVHMQNRASGTVRNCRITGMRTGIDINNSSGITVRNNDITFNRTGMLLRNKTDNLTVIENKITDNWTVGVLFLDASTGSNVPVQTAANCSFSNNDISGNWYGDIVDRQTGGSLPAPGANLKNFSGNWLGTATPVVSTDNSAEPAYAVQIPLAYGGEAVNPGGAPNILGPASANIDYSPWLAVGDDMDGGAAGFKGDPATLWVDDGSPQTGMTGRLQEGVDLVAEAGTVNVLAGTYTEQVVIGKPLNLQGAGQGATIVKAFDAMPATFTTPGPSVNHAVVIVQGTNGVRIADMTIDGDHRGGTNVRFEGIGVRNAGVLVTRVLVTGIRNEPFSGAQHGTGIYGHNDDGVDRTVSVVDCDVVDFQKSGIVLNGASMDALVCGCTVTGVGDTTVTAQNGIQLGSGASGTICHNTVADCYYLSDAWGASGILGASAGSVSILSNTVSGCAGGLRVDNYSGVTGPVVIDGNVLEGNGFSTVWGCEDVAVTGNSFDLSGQGLWLIDSDDVVVERNTFNDCDYGLFVDGDCNGVTVSECEFLDAAGIGLAVEPYGTDPTGVVVQSCDFTGSAVGLSNTSANPVVALNNYWGTPTGPDAATNPGGTGAAVEGSVSFSPWLGDGTDDPDTLGFQPNPTPVYYLPTELVFSQDPVGGMVDAELAAQPIVTVKNERGETATQYNGSVALAIALPNPGAPVPGVLDGDVEVPVVNGVATFSGLKVLGGSAVGYRLVATSLTLPAETSVAFDVGNHAVDIQAVQGAWTVVDEQEPLTFTVTAFDADTPTQTLTFSIDPPSFDAGMRIDAATGAFAWTPTEAQGSGAVYPVTITVTDNGSPATVASRSFAITVAEVNVAPELAAIGDQGVNEQVPLTFTATATDQDDPDQALVFSLTGDVPTGADIDADTGVFTWKPTEAQGGAAYTFMVVVTDNGANPASLADSEEITVTVAEVNVAPVLGTIPPQSVNFGQTLTFTATAADQDEPAQRLSFGLIGAPDGAAIDASTGVFAWTPTEAQAQSNHSFTVTVADNGAPAMGDEQTVSIGAVSATQYCPGYRSPSVNMVVSNSVAFGGALTSLTWTPDLPEGWTVTSAAAVGGNGTAEVVGGAVAFSALPATSPVAFTYTVNVPGNQAVSNSVGAVLGFNGLTVDVAPIAVYRYHSADYQTRDGMFRTIDSREMTRLLGYWRRGAYSLSASGLDGYASSVDPGPGTLSNCHSADYSRDGRISTDEMLLVQMYWGAMGYHVDLEGEDGYGVQVDGPGPSRMALSVVSVEPSVAGVETSVPEGYNPGQTLVVTNTFTLTDDTLGALYWRFQLPNGWGIASVDADGLPLEVHGNEVVVMTSPLPSSVTLVCGIAVPLTEARACAFEVESVYRTYANTKASVLSDGAALLGALDADGDGLADAWAARYAAILGAALDPDTDYDGDRHTVRQEYLSGTDPLDEQSVLQMHNVGFLADGRARVEWPSVAGRVYALERADGAPAAANFGAVATDVAADPSGVNAYEDDVDPSVPHFYRVKLLSPQAQD
jgi:parallel beta-helix repeat protein